MPRSFEEIYSIAPESAVSRLIGFRDAHPARSMEKQGMLYRVWDVGKGERAMVFLPGGMGNGEQYFGYLSDLSSEMRCIAFSLPECSHMEDFARQIHSLLTEDLKVKEILLVCGGIGGLIGQTYLRMFPQEVFAAAFITCGAPCRELPKQFRTRWVQRRKMAGRYALSPFDSMRQSLGYQTFTGMCPEELQEGMSFWRAFISETYEHRIYKKMFINLNCRALPEIYKKCPFHIGDMKDWPGRVLIMESEEDQYYGPEERDLLKKLYPGAEVVDIGRLGQFAVMANETEAIAQLRKFVRSIPQDSDQPSAVKE